MNLEKFNQQAFDNKSSAVWLRIADEPLLYSEQIVRLQKLYCWLKENKALYEGPVVVAVEDDMERMSLINALISIGQPIIIFDPAGTQYETSRILSDCQFYAVIAEEHIFERLKLFDYEQPYLKVIKPKKTAGVFGRLLADKSVRESETSWPLHIESNDLLEPEKIISSNQTSSEDLALVVFTSGTTNRSKGVEISYGALLSQLNTLKNQFELSESSKLLNTLPLHHVDGLIQGPVIAWFTGASVHRPCIFSAQQLDNFLNSIYRERITHLIAVPTMLSVIHRLGLEWRENFESPDFKFVVSCAGHLELSLWKSFEEEFNVRVVNMYGLTETVTSALFSGPDDISRRIGTLGKPINSQIKIIDREGNTVHQGIVGELLISSAQLMKGYHGDVKSSIEVLVEGWLSSGDLVKELDTGHIELVGRKKNQIISGGKNISPEEVSETINLHDDVVESIILGQADREWGESVAALVVTSNTKISEVEVISWCRTQLSEYKVPRYLFFVNELAKGPSGKTLLLEARKELEKKLFILEENKTTDKNIDSQVLRISANVFRIEQNKLSPSSSPENTDGWDSLAHMNLVLELEQIFDISLTTRDIMRINTLESAIEICRQKIG